MAGSYSNWNMIQIPKRPNSPSQIACRICNHVFMSTQALIDHIETHMGDDINISGSRRQSTGRNLRNPSCNYNPSSSSSLPANNYHFPCLQEIRNNSLLSGRPQMGSRRPLMPSQPPRYLVGVRNSNRPSIAAQLQVSIALTQTKANGEQPPSDCTEPFLQQLDIPYCCNSKMNDFDMLDLTLKL